MDNTLASQSCDLLPEQWQMDSIQTQALTPDGSQRRFCRLIHRDGSRVIGIAPPADDPVGLKEAVAGWHIGRHLLACQAPVPELYGFDRNSGLLVCEDLGEVRLHELIQQKGVTSDQVVKLYQQTVVELAKMQVRAREDFDCSWCWDTPRYDRQLMLNRESGYFLQAFCLDLLNLAVEEQELACEFSLLADRAALADASFFLHRDFQSRNIMVQENRVRFIDYQAGRLGPAGYDLASLLIDPYAALPQSLQDQLLELYLQTLTALVPCNRQQFHREYLLLAIQRNLQILGAFAFLSQQRNKPFFRQYIPPALRSLQSLLAKVGYGEYPCLTSLVNRAGEHNL